MSTTVSTLHLRPIDDGSWSLNRDEAEDIASVYPTEGQAIASVYERIAEPGEAEVVIHEADGRGAPDHPEQRSLEGWDRQVSAAPR